MLSQFSLNKVAANGAWTLFLADLSSESRSRVKGWSVQITATSGTVQVPEPVPAALLLLGACLLAASGWHARHGGQIGQGILLKRDAFVQAQFAQASQQGTAARGPARAGLAG